MNFLIGIGNTLLIEGVAVAVVCLVWQATSGGIF